MYVMVLLENVMDRLLEHNMGEGSWALLAGPLLFRICDFYLLVDIDFFTSHRKKGKANGKPRI